MATTAREALHTFLANLLEAQKDNPPTIADYIEALSGYPSVPDLTDPHHKVRNVLNLQWSLAYPPFTDGLVFIPDPRDGAIAQAIHDKFRDLNVAAQQEKSDETQ